MYGNQPAFRDMGSRLGVQFKNLQVINLTDVWQSISAADYQAISIQSTTHMHVAEGYIACNQNPQRIQGQ